MLLRIFFSIFLLTHGLIHFMGFAKAFGYGNISQVTRAIPKAEGVLWFITAILFSIGAVLFLVKQDWEWIALAAVLVSQVLIILTWEGAKWGTIANFIILTLAVLSYAGRNFENKFRILAQKSIDKELLNTAPANNRPGDLPLVVQNYIKQSGFEGHPPIKNFKLYFEGEIRQDPSSPWMPFTTEQYNLIDKPARFFFMKASMRHLPVAGFHCFMNGQASMDIRLLSLFRVQYQRGPEMDISETVTWLNDICLYAPLALTDKRIRWREIYRNVAEAVFTNNNITVSAKLYFNSNNQLVNFVSEDRYAYARSGMTKQKWSTPVKDYRSINGHLLNTCGEAVYVYPQGDLCYGKFRLKKIEYNVTG